MRITESQLRKMIRRAIREADNKIQDPLSAAVNFFLDGKEKEAEDALRFAKEENKVTRAAAVKAFGEMELQHTLIDKVFGSVGKEAY